MDTTTPQQQQAAGAGAPVRQHAVQVSNVTRGNRYPQVFAAAKLMIEAAGLHRGRVLSYGCSTGEEPATLASQYLPEAEVVGLDVSPEALDTAKRMLAQEPRITLDLSTPETLAAHGPYAAIFAMSVLCRWPTSRRMDNIAGLFPFVDFTAQVAALDQVLQPGGLLVIYNANYEFLQSPAAARYDVVLSPRVRTSGFVKKFQPDGSAAAITGVTACLFRKRELGPEADSPALAVYSERLIKLGEVPRPLPIPGA
jgi:SAM-dependent methyltransferase